MQTLLIMIGKKQPNKTCIFKSSLHGSSYANMMQRVLGRRGLLFVIKCDDTNTIAVFADTKLQLPADPTCQLYFGCPVSLFSVCGAFEEGITKIDLLHDEHFVWAAGTRGAVTDKNGEPWGKMCIAGGRLWLGNGEHGPTDDLLNCSQWVKKKELPGNRKLGKTHNFTAQRVEVFQTFVLSLCRCGVLCRPADPILSEADLRALVDATGKTDATPHLLYKGERDGWEPEAMFKNVGDATDLLLLLKDLGGPIIASHIEGGLTSPADPTAVATTPCAVSLFSVRGAFEGNGITKIELPQDKQDVRVAGTQGAVQDRNGEPVAIVCIGDMTDDSPGRLWLGIGYHGSAADVRSCQQWEKKEELPADKKYIGTTDNKGRVWLASSFNFTAADMEIFTLQPSAGWQWVSAVASVMMDSRST
ncbi:unnamed protein product [Vitrella brassicaformis CCMP3155]|uniref:TLDc domain-containing protein n=1 Tax=Vitrella brassicaformis (strain CCMP3155) TaxID=1169540 RepID=A0A0G4FAA8_VITBC|nr:unnamed protein product [Vitrella brassicaformis CCMP3155]|eukprot:CEM09918.1 unnamed protein product [Vitrella brassicaformis CCMP3155]